MSSFVYGTVTAKRAASPAGMSKTTSPPAIGVYIDALAALVPAEALALYAGIVLPYSTRTVSVHGHTATIISDPNLLSWSCVGLLALSSLLYAVGRKNADLREWDILRLLIPPAAFAAWMLVQTPGVFEIWWPGSSIGGRAVIAAFAAVLLGILASVLGYQVNQAPGTLVVTGVSPEKGPMAGGTSVTVTGSGFTGATAVSFGAVADPKPTVSSDIQLTAISPPVSTPGTVDVTVTTAAGTSASSPADQFTYEQPPAAPVVTGIHPTSGRLAGQNLVIVAGSGFTGATAVSFGTAPALHFVVPGDTRLAAYSPPGDTAGPVDVTVTTPAGTSATSPADQFTYIAP